MPTINELSTVDTLAGNDKLPVFSTANNDSRKATVDTLSAKVKADTLVDVSATYATRARVGDTLINARARGMVTDSSNPAIAAANSVLMDQLISEQGRIVFDHGLTDTASAVYFFSKTMDFGDNHMDIVGMGQAGTDLRFIGGTPAVGNHGVRWAGANQFNTAPRIEGIEISCGWASPVGAAGLYIEGQSGSGQFGVMNNERVLISRSGLNAWDIGVWHRGFSGSRWTHLQVGGNKTGEGNRVMRYGVLVDDGLTAGGARISAIDVTWDQLRVFSAETGWQIQGDESEGGVIIGSQIQYVDTGIRKMYTPTAPETRYLPQVLMHVTKTHVRAYRECIDLPCARSVVIEGNELYLDSDTTFPTAKIIQAIGRAGTRVLAAEKCMNVRISNNSFSGVNLPLGTTSYGVDTNEYENVVITNNVMESIVNPVRFGVETVDCRVGVNNISRMHPQENVRVLADFNKANFVQDAGVDNSNLKTVTTDTNANVTCAPNGGTILDTATLTAARSRNLYPNNLVKGDIVTVQVNGAGAFNRVYRDQATGTAVATMAVGQSAMIMWDGAAFVLLRVW